MLFDFPRVRKSLFRLEDEKFLNQVFSQIVLYKLRELYLFLCNDILKYRQGVLRSLSKGQKSIKKFEKTHSQWPVVYSVIITGGEEHFWRGVGRGTHQGISTILNLLARAHI